MDEIDRDHLIRMTTFEHLRGLEKIRDHLTYADLRAGFNVVGERIPLINVQRGIFKPRQMRFLLSVRTVYPRTGARVWYDDQREVHRQIFEGEEAVDYAFMGQNPDAADNRWLREAFENQIPSSISWAFRRAGIKPFSQPSFADGTGKRCERSWPSGSVMKRFPLCPRLFPNAVMLYAR